MARSAWIAWSLVGVGFSALLSGCVISSSDTTDGGVISPGGTGGGGNAAGADAGTTGGTAGAATGGTAGAATGGTAGAATAGGAGGATGSLWCQVGGTSTPASDCGSGAGGAGSCDACLATSCCDQLKACNATAPNDECGFGGPAGQGEFNCILDCTRDPASSTHCTTEIAESQGAYTCCGTSECVTPSCARDTINPITTQDVASCAWDNCPQCF